ncbi:MAG: DUF4263 domain-containing protein [Chloroflexota bacterium]|nr:DUF4263 domain-containing protein [Chloroflexota bacterium]
MKFKMTGHHGLWVLPQQTIRERGPSGTRRLVPDYLIAAQSSEGVTYWILDLKGADADPFKRPQGHDYLAFSDHLNRGICQVLTYIDYAASVQEHFRDTHGFRMKDFREPRGMILIGTEDTLENDPERMQLRGAWNRNFANCIEIRTYGALLGQCETILDFRARTPTP